MTLVIMGCSKQHQITLDDRLDLAIEEIFADDLYEDVFSESFEILFDPHDYSLLNQMMMKGMIAGPKRSSILRAQNTPCSSPLILEIVAKTGLSIKDSGR